MPDQFLLKDLAKGALKAAIDDEELEDNWDDLWESVIDGQRGQLTSGREVLSHRLSGWPAPDQCDPRLTAASAARGVLELFGRQPTEAETAECEKEMHEWTLLLQVELCELWGGFGEGTVYYVMRKSDLGVRSFSRVHAVYQQT
jgi:uncharacterized protein YwqG